MDEPMQTMARKVMIALDFPEAKSAINMVEEFAGIPCWFKVGMELFYAEGPAIVREIKDAGHSVFIDLKLHDIPNTVKGAAASLTRLGADMFNVHAAGGIKMMQAAREGVASASMNVREPLLIAVTQLTSTDQMTMNKEIGISGCIEDTVIRYASLAKEAGMDGVVSSAQETKAIKTECGASFMTITPGIRPANSAQGDQSRTLTPGQAVQQGTDFLVIGRPITMSEAPRLALTNILREMANVKNEGVK